jgi:hypothetical protein
LHDWELERPLSQISDLLITLLAGSRAEDIADPDPNSETFEHAFSLLRKVQG